MFVGTKKLAMVHYTEYDEAPLNTVLILPTVYEMMKLFGPAKDNQELIFMASKIMDRDLLFVVGINENTAEARIDAIKLFENKLYPIDFIHDLMFINREYHRAMIALCELRNDCCAWLSIPDPFVLPDKMYEEELRNGFNKSTCPQSLQRWT